MNTCQRHHAIEQFLFDVAEHCDRQRWDDYLAAFDPAAPFHVPQWDSEHVYTLDPRREMSLIYYPDRKGLEDRVYRLRTGKSAAATPMPRTLHLVSNVRVLEESAGELEVAAKWLTHFHRLGSSGVFFGEATYRLAEVAGRWRILGKHVLLLNDTINEVLDFYHL